MEKELSIYQVKFKALNDGLLTRNSLEVTIFGEDMEQVKERFEATKLDMSIPPHLEFKVIDIIRR